MSRSKNFADGLKKIFGLYNGPDEAFFERLSDTLIEGDIGAKTAMLIEDELRAICKKEKLNSEEDVLNSLYKITLPYVKSCEFIPEKDKVSIYLILGVNGVGKTTTIAKMAHYYKSKYSTPIILAAGDTFRAAAIEQLKFHGEKNNVRVVAHKNGGDPGAVIFDAGEAMAASGGGLVLADTAGRLHNKENLVRELQKIDRIAKTKAGEGCYKKILVLDSTTGQNGLRQAEVFHNAVGIDAIVLTKYDSTAKGGAAITAGKELSLPVLFAGTGEKYEDLIPFSPEDYVKEFIGKR
ncbi:signal recognition particle-docking protein FtsY [Treponema pedis]|uniref:Signal recognition particle-docking protein FtsY n=1 Tax=Treponema pedis TaxID=409322 RepID=A0A7S7AVL8_9SPIR|nr:signal recognition particle-docking protein FtsY [Treponema pedis]QOW59764.1 signal recognition particle-docking protein FtsY [Treponema pedis]